MKILNNIRHEVTAPAMLQRSVLISAHLILHAEIHNPEKSEHEQEVKR